uniref:Sepiapterin reductase n=1 Tax=Plectus sambesii TaxID=2011161 RepID=A0A914W4C0_9BILA
MALSGKKALCLITGASQGIGREIAAQLAALVAANSTFILTARQQDKLDETADLIKQVNSGATVKTIACDLIKIESHLSDFTIALQDALKEAIEVSVIVHNAGSIGDVQRRARDAKDGDDLRAYLNINVVSMALLNSTVLNVLCSDAVKLRIVVNITSLLAIKGFPSFGYYATGKAAREGLMRVLASEEQDLRVLNYSPGPVETNMVRQIATDSYDEGIRQTFQNKTGSDVSRAMLKPETTVKKLMKVLDENQFESGTRTDYFDD